MLRRVTTSEDQAEVLLRLHTTQSRPWHSRRRFKVIVAGRRWGKTWYARAKLVRHAGVAGRFWYVAPTYRMARDIFWNDLKAVIHRTWSTKPPNETLMEIETIWGCLLALKGADDPLPNPARAGC